jgi:hypothetical protein
MPISFTRSPAFTRSSPQIAHTPRIISVPHAENHDFCIKCAAAATPFCRRAPAERTAAQTASRHLFLESGFVGRRHR